ncbi:MAG: tetratricopeptide repeat protein [Deltaproteobacteria bacterium]|nr:tetratricopeptide repeat protein [Deltaproteobacteria bacterium]
MIDIRAMTVLIVDDMPNMAASIRSMMKILGYGKEFPMAGDGQEAWRVLKKRPVDMTILDYEMPLMSGMDLLRQIRDDRDLRDLPVVMVTAQANRDFVAEAGESEVGAYVLKPVTVKVLDEKVSRVIANANNPSPMVVHLKRGRQFEQAGDLDSAIEEARLAVKANPKATRPIRELGYYYFKKEDLQEAEKWLLKAARLNPLDVFAFHHLGELYLRLQDIESASRCFEKAMKISPRHLARGIQFGKALVAMKRTAEAVKVFERVFRLADNPPQLKEEIAGFCLENGAYDYAAELLGSLVERQPGLPSLWFDLAVTHEKRGDLRRAVFCLVKADEKAKTDIDIKARLAKNYLALGKPTLAERALKQILSAHPENLLARELMMKCIEDEP